MWPAVRQAAAEGAEKILPNHQAVGLHPGRAAGTKMGGLGGRAHCDFIGRRIGQGDVFANSVIEEDGGVGAGQAAEGLQVPAHAAAAGRDPDPDPDQTGDGDGADELHRRRRGRLAERRAFDRRQGFRRPSDRLLHNVTLELIFWAGKRLSKPSLPKKDEDFSSIQAKYLSLSAAVAASNHSSMNNAYAIVGREPMGEVRRPLIVGLGGTTRIGSSSEQALALALSFAAAKGADTVMFGGRDLLLPLYDPQPTGAPHSAEAEKLVSALRQADGVILASPCYHGGVSGLVKNAIDYTEEMRADTRPYLDGRAVGCIACGFGWQGPNAVLAAMRSVVHALRGWPTPLGVAINTASTAFKNGECSEGAVTQQIEMMAGQVVTFARANMFSRAELLLSV